MLFLKNLLNDPGRKANEKERQAALRVAEDFISRMRYAPNTQVRRYPVPQALPCGLFPRPPTPRTRQEGQESLRQRQEQSSLPTRPTQWRSSSHSFKILKSVLFSERMRGSTPLGAQRARCAFRQLVPSLGHCP